ncbi:YceI family protein [Dyella tabacisoli]|uniref:Polyisoprenoid-binding protein n=1 Tax=Dyella tabacisoli TaxID=2282381 RepID=A0A369UIB8_9GAMM|nr:YceI family protein [Dyella tabacisoli]RDD80311.1 polyisoprenoid-binding protein [Dyella tabacisoli]
MRAYRYLLITGLLGATVAAHADPVTYKLDPAHTNVLFSWSHFGYSNPSANFGLGDGTLVFDEKNPAKSSVEVTLPLANLDTHVTKLDEHLKKPDFFDADKFPTATFKSTKVQPLGGGKFKVTGDLTVHGVTKPVVLDAKLNKSGEHPMLKQQAIGFDATTSLKRSDFGIGAYVPNVGDEIKIRITTEGAVPKADATQ